MQILSRLSLAAIALSLPLAARGQAIRLLDEGSFIVTVAGKSWQEDFTIRVGDRGSGPEVTSRATISLPSGRMKTELVTDSSGRPISYLVQSLDAGGKPLRWSGQFVHGHVVATILGDQGQAQREFLMADGAVAIDDDAVHQYYFAARARQSTTVTVVVPRKGIQVRLRLAVEGPERLTIGGKETGSTRILLTEPSGAARRVWVDDRGRVLRVAIESLGLVAVREELPASTLPAR